MILFYNPYITKDILTLSEEESKHCVRVLRLRPGDHIHITDGKGNLHECEIIGNHHKKCSVKIINTQKNYGKRDYKIHLAVAPTKNINRFEWFLEKATEAGIDEITPIICEYSERKIIKPERLVRVITSAVKQSLKAYHPKLNDAVSFNDFIKKANYSNKYIAFINKDVQELLKNHYPIRQDVLIIIGPEGDFSKTEVKHAKESGFIPISLGENRYRTETAALVSCLTINLINE